MRTSHFVNLKTTFAILALGLLLLSINSKLKTQYVRDASHYNLEEDNSNIPILNDASELPSIWSVLKSARSFENKGKMNIYFAGD